MGENRYPDGSAAAPAWAIKRRAWIVPIVFVLLILAGQTSGQQKLGPRMGQPSLNLRPVSLGSPPETLLNPEARVWASTSVQRISMNRTPPLYDTDPPAPNEIPSAEVRVVRTGGKTVILLSWHDSTDDSADLTAAPAAPAEQRNRKEQSAATDRFFDAAAVMVPTQTIPHDLSPSLQMGDAHSPVKIYYWNAARGPMLMEAQGRSTTRRTGQGFPAKGIYHAGMWAVSFELPELQTGTPLAFAIWNGSQKDRDGRKYFSVWHWLE
ncbi:MAG: hypothetical protein ACHQKY_18225 [Terriglobia bacterium]